ncbi:MAG: MBL fold metallo-hydrolase [Magnetococcales bacterium]|nr:MBL fold metallo-hydrolase [Magnetococcales bacterium]NGZ27479.1 MBL fold metallo-hydrolase [Magnetococcales bacterium]
MMIRFWGVRGSIPFPGPKSVRYGGNTTCIEVRNSQDDLIILDGGTGIFPLAQTLLGKLPVRCHIFITHTHWDHIQGLPFFIPLFIPGCRVDIYGAFDPINLRDIRDILSRQMEYCYFPVREVELKAEIRYHTLREGECVQVGTTKITNMLMNHPVLNFGYKLEEEGKSVFFSGDHEWPYNIYDPTDDGFDEYEQLIVQQRANMIDFIRGMDALIMDSAYTEKEYPSKKGWGHGTLDSSILVAKEAQVKNLFLTHHEPTRSDDLLEQLFQETVARYQFPPDSPKLHLAYEGLTFQV